MDLLDKTIILTIAVAVTAVGSCTWHQQHDKQVTIRHMSDNNYSAPAVRCATQPDDTVCFKPE